MIREREDIINDLERREKELREMLQQKKQDLMDKVAERDRMYKRLDENASKAGGDASTSSLTGDKSGVTGGLMGVKQGGLTNDVKVTYEDDDEGDGDGEGEGDDDWIGDADEDQPEEEEEEVDNSLNVSNTSDHHQPQPQPLVFTPMPFEVPYSAAPAPLNDLSSNSRGQCNLPWIVRRVLYL